MLVYGGSRIYEIRKAEICQVWRYVKKMFKTDADPTDLYFIRLYVIGQDDYIVPDGDYMSLDKAEALIHKLYQDGKIDLSDFGLYFSGMAIDIR